MPWAHCGLTLLHQVWKGHWETERLKDQAKQEKRTETPQADVSRAELPLATCLGRADCFTVRFLVRFHLYFVYRAFEI